MITGTDIYEVVSAIVPLYVALILAYGSVRWWKIFTPDQCSGIGRFVAVFAVPLLGFHFISSNNLYAMNLRFITADSLQKLVILLALFLCQCLWKDADLGWNITLFSLSTLPNTLVLGIPLLEAMYGEFSGSLMVQIVVLQSVVWYTLLIFLLEYRAAKELVSEQIPPELAPAITSFRVEPDVSSLGGSERVVAETEVGQDGKLQMVVRRWTSADHDSVASMNLKASSSLRGIGCSPRTPGDDNGCDHGRKSRELMNGRRVCSNLVHYPALSCGGTKEGGDDDRVNMPVKRWSSMPIVLKVNRGGRVASVDFESLDSSYSPFQRNTTAPGGSHACSENASPAKSEGRTRETRTKVGCNTPLAGSTSVVSPKSDLDIETGEQGDGIRHGIPSGVMTTLILTMAWKKLARNPNTYASIIGLTWSLVSFRWNIEMPKMVKGSISIISDAGLGMAMFSLGLFMALQPKIIACGKSAAALAMAVRFLVGPAVAAATSTTIGIRRDLLRISIVQAALPGGIVPFVLAKEYNCYADIASTSVAFGMLVALPVTIVYYFLLGL